MILNFKKLKAGKLMVCLLLAFATQAHAQQTDEQKKTEEQKKAEAWANFQKMIEERVHKDWPWLKRYEEDNAKLPAPAAGEKRVVFMGNSITEGWINTDPDFFKGKPYVNRGIGGQTTPQMLVRFREDVINLKPKVVVILAGINDIAENTGPSKIENVAGNIFSMAELAKFAGIKVVLSSVIPAKGFPWHPGLDPREPIMKLNTMLKEYAAKNHLGYIDYYSAMVGPEKELRKELCVDGVHPNMAGYKVMEPLAEIEIKKALK
ncbi:SGNH/GDSL hydrolase family protein [Mucilaginibacter achroorhodeus]|nr:SGNH/GDSL hydrolase family protein [Mucilaginibacter achroorhodeus]